ncbi:pyridoxal phosphate-dependent transferase [Aspergillus egyptiacus]|nr:pyridoxal phosphate-dependent transferase [Aspergillus egyptiacus]
MVHLATIKKDDDFDHSVRRADSIQLETTDEDDNSTTVYGSRFAVEKLPHKEMPDREMPREVTYRMIKDDLSLDGNPMLNLASFVTAYMEDEAEKLMSESLSKNFIDYEVYPQSAKIQNRCVNMITRLFNAPTNSEDEHPVGTSTVGSSEAIMLGTLAMKKRWQNSAVQVCWEKAARYFDIEERYVFCTEDCYVIDPQQAVDLVDENTIGICAILGTTYTGEYEDVKAIHDLLIKGGIDCPIHVNAASGGFISPFIHPTLQWDFRLERVVSINVSGHNELIFNINYLGAEQASFTLNFSKGASQVIGQYYQMIRLGKRGYRSIMVNITRIADYQADQLEKLGFIIMSQRRGQGLPLVAFRFPERQGELFDELALAHQLRERGWIVPAYTIAPNSNSLKLMRVVVWKDFTMSRCDTLLGDIKACYEDLA